MKRSILLWILAVVLTLASAAYQRRTGPSYPIKGETTFAGTLVEYELTRTHPGAGDQPVPIIAPDDAISGSIIYRRFKTDDPWKGLALVREADKLVGYLPHQPAAGKLEYYVELRKGTSILRLPDHESAVTRFRGDVPMMILIIHVIVMFASMLLSMRAGMEALVRDGKPRSHALWAFGLMLLGGLVLGPIVQKFSFGAYWTGFPFGMDLTDNKTLIAAVLWFIAVAAVWNRGYEFTAPQRRWFVVVASVVTLIIFMIPHSMMGSELDYKKLDALKKTDTTAIRTP